MTDGAHAHLQQARSDFAAAQMMLRHGGQESQATMLLQMAWEKLAKAVLAHRQDFDPFTHSHVVAERFAALLKLAPRIGDILDSNEKVAKQRLKTLRRSVGQLEKLTPALAQMGENTEYPWKAANGQAKWPARDLTREFCRSDRPHHLWPDFQRLAENFDRLFGR